jgi:branched-chain amino acid transport system substrate-binding protein
MQNKDQRYNRREFLRLAGLGAGAVLVGAGATAPGKAAAAGLLPATTGATPKVGVLLPQSTVAPQLAAGFLAGLRLAGAVNLVPVTLGSGQAATQARQLLETEQAGVLVGMVNARDAAQIGALAAAHNTVLLATGLGENVPRQGEDHPAVFRHTLGLWQAHWALGAWAARTLGRRAVIASAWYESGYDALYSFQAGFESAGGQVVATHITHGPVGPNGLAALPGQINKARPDFVFAAYSGAAAAEFAQAYSAAGLAARLPLLGAAFLADEALLATLGATANGLKTALGWSPTLATADNQAFGKAYLAATGRTPDAFALLGYEAGRIVLASVRSSGLGITSANPAKALTGLRLQSPRGLLALDTATRTFGGPLYLREVQQGSGGLQNTVLATLPAPAGDKQIAALAASVPTGWLNTYLGI